MRPDQPLQLIVRRLDLIDLSGTVRDAHQHPLQCALAQIEQQQSAGPNAVTMCVVDKVTIPPRDAGRRTPNAGRIHQPVLSDYCVSGDGHLRVGWDGISLLPHQFRSSASSFSVQVGRDSNHSTVRRTASGRSARTG